MNSKVRKRTNALGGVLVDCPSGVARLALWTATYRAPFGRFRHAVITRTHVRCLPKIYSKTQSQTLV